jgi:hypothetical protein
VTEPNRPSSRPSDPAVEAAARGRFVHRKSSRSPKRRRRHNHQRIRAPPPGNAGAFSIPQFCAAHGAMSEAFYHKLQTLGLGPKTMRVGGRTMISIEAAAQWRRDCEERERALTIDRAEREHREWELKQSNRHHAASENRL